MELTLQQVIALTQGAERIWQENGAIFFSRFTEEEMKIYEAHSNLRAMVVSTAGIQLEFTTDATSLRLGVTTPPERNYSDYFSYDILVNETLIGRLSNVAEDAENGYYNQAACKVENPVAEFDLGAGEKTVRITFPWSMNLGIRELVLENATFVRPVLKNKKLLIFGDSISQGSGSIYSSKTYACLLRDWLQADAISKAVGSEQYFPALAQATPSRDVDYITIAYGINDWANNTKENFIANCTGFLQSICKNYPNAKKFVFTPVWYLNRAAVTPFCEFEELVPIFRQITEEFPDVTLIDCTDFVSRDTADFGDLYIHPNHKGYAKYTENLKTALTPYL